MKTFKAIVLALVLAIGVGAAPAQAQVRFGLKAGINVSNLHLDKMANGEVGTLWKDNNQTGFTGGAMVEFTVPVVGLGFDLSAMYVRRNAQYLKDNNVSTDHRDYIEVPLNLKWKIGIPVVGKIITPYLTTGPSFAFLTSRRNIENAYKNKSFDTAWNFGFGVQLVNHLQIGASYGLGLTKALKTVGATGNAGIEAKNNYWTVTAAYLF